MIKKILVLSIVALICCQCHRASTRDVQWRQNNGKIKVLTTIAMIDDLVQKIGGERVDSLPLIRGELDPHSYEIVKGDEEKFFRADLIFYNGLGLEHGLSLRRHLADNPKAIAVADPILKSDPSLILVVEGAYDPHIWMDISLWQRIIDPIVSALTEIDPIHASEYHERADKLRKEMEKADQFALERLRAIDPAKRYLVTSHDAFSYFTRHYLADPADADWRVRCAAPEGLAPEAQMSLFDLMEIMNHVEKFHISVLFPEANVSRDSLRKICDACAHKGIEIRLCQETLYGDSMGDQGGSYLDMIEHNINLIARELNHG